MDAKALLTRIEAIVTSRAAHLGHPAAVADIVSPELAVILDGRGEIDAVLTALHASAGRTDWLNLDDVDLFVAFTSRTVGVGRTRCERRTTRGVQPTSTRATALSTSRSYFPGLKRPP